MKKARSKLSGKLCNYNVFFWTLIIAISSAPAYSQGQTSQSSSVTYTIVSEKEDSNEDSDTPDNGVLPPIPAHASTAMQPNGPTSLLPGQTPDFKASSKPDNSRSAVLSDIYLRKKKGVYLTKTRSKHLETTNKNGLRVTSTRPASNPEKTQITQSSYMLVLGSFDSEYQAHNYWYSFTIRYPILAQSKYHRVTERTSSVSSDAPFRLQLESFYSRASAEKKCRQIISDGNHCSVISAN